jgi:hypothetical protein
VGTGFPKKSCSTRELNVMMQIITFQVAILGELE